MVLINKKGFTFVELLITMTIVGVLAMIMIGAINPKFMTDKAQDANRKKDIRRISIALEEYQNDKGCYPTRVMVDNIDCAEAVSWMTKWPCDPNGQKYYVIMDETSPACPRYYRVLTNLKNTKDTGIPEGWYDAANTLTFDGGDLTKDEVNFGVSSSNIIWNE